MDAIRWVYRMGSGNPQHVRQLTDVGAGVSLAPNSPVRAGPLAGGQAAVDLRKAGPTAAGSGRHRRRVALGKGVFYGTIPCLGRRTAGSSRYSCRERSVLAALSGLSDRSTVWACSLMRARAVPASTARPHST